MFLPLGMPFVGQRSRLKCTGDLRHTGSYALIARPVRYVVADIDQRRQHVMDHRHASIPHGRFYRAREAFGG